jgi:hypothetical protein
MTSSIDSLTGMPMPAIASTQGVGARPNLSAANASESNAAEGGGFHKLMHLQQRGRTLEEQLKRDAAAAPATDPAAKAKAAQTKFTATEFQKLRELVGPNPGGNARRALAALLERLEGGGELKSTDRARVRLAIAADEQRVDLAGANAFREAILAIDRAAEKSSAIASDPMVAQDPDRLADFQARNRGIQNATERLIEMTGAAHLDHHAAHAIASSFAQGDSAS